MLQTPLALDTRLSASTPAADEADTQATGFAIGWDHARHGLVPPEALLADGHPVGQGWRAAQSVLTRKALPARPALRQWLALRLQAWSDGEGFDLDQLTPQHLAQIASTRCPVRRVTLGGAAGEPDAPVVLRLNDSAAWAAGHLVVLSRAAARAMHGVDSDEARRRARLCEARSDALLGLDAAAWWRVATLRAFATPLPFAAAAQLPLAVLPPNRVRLLNAAQGLQALVTQTFAAPGWAARCARIGQALPEHTLRTDFNLFVGAMAPRVLAATAPSADLAALKTALEDAWQHERVQRRWTHFVLSLGEAGCEALLEGLATLPQPGRHVLLHGAEQAVQAWRLPQPAPRATVLSRLTARSRRGSAPMLAPAATIGHRATPLPA